MKTKVQKSAYDTNLLSWMFLVARDEDLLRRALLIIQFIRENPNISEDEVRKELKVQNFATMPPKNNLQ